MHIKLKKKEISIYNIPKYRQIANKKAQKKSINRKQYINQ